MKPFLTLRSKIVLLKMAMTGAFAYALLSALFTLTSLERQFFAIDEDSEATRQAVKLLRDSDAALGDLISATRLAEDERDVATLRARLEEIVGQKRQIISALKLGSARKQTLEAQLELYGTQMERLIDARVAILGAEERLATLGETLEEFTARLDGVANAFLSQAGTLLHPGSLPAEELLARSTQLLRVQASMAALLSRLRGGAAGEHSARIEALFDAETEIANVVRHLVTLKWAEAPDDFAAVLGEGKRFIGATAGIVAALEDASAEESRFAAALTEVADARRRSSDAVTAAAAAALRLAEEGRTDVIGVERDRSHRSAVLAALIGCSAIIIAWLVMDFGILRRIERLTGEMNRIAAGDLDTPVRSGGEDEVGQMARALAIFRSNASELVRSNEELGNFAYVASHDLRSPLRAIQNLVDWTIEDAEDELAPELLSNLQMIRGRAERLSALLTDLLDYARAGSEATTAEVLHLPGLVRDIAEIADPDRRFEIAFEGDRCLTAPGTPVRTILRNLISNAIKHHDAQSGRIVVTHRRCEGMSTLCVADDGPGIAAQYQAKVFDIFQTLAASDASGSAGSGMGLALVRKLVTVLGGNIRLTSAPQDRRGATFIIELPNEASLGGNGRVTSDEARGEAA